MIKIRRKIPEAWYCGSLIQQNHGESVDKGILIWDIKSKSDFSIEEVLFESESPYISIKLNDDNSIPEIDIPAGSKLRLIIEKQVTADQLKVIKKQLREKYKPSNLSHIDNSVNDGLSDLEGAHYSQENLRDLSVQEELIYLHLKEREIDDEVFQAIFEINKQVDEEVDYEDGYQRHSTWSVKNFIWENLFSYGESNTIDFSKLNGIIGIFGKSFTGKSSVVDSILFTIFNEISKRNSKTVEFINENKKEASSEIQLQINGENYQINRSLKRTKRKGSNSASGDVDFKKDELSLNGLDRNDTDKNIQRLVGTLEDFKLTSMIPQFDSLKFLNAGNVEKKEILAKILDLDVFSKKHKIAKINSEDLRGAIKVNGKRDFEKDIERYQKSLEPLKQKAWETKSIWEISGKEVDLLKAKINEKNSNLIEIDLPKSLNYAQLLKEDAERLVTIENSISQIDIEKLKADVKKLEEKVPDSTQISELNEKIGSLMKSNQEIKYKKSSLNKELQVFNKKSELLCQVPCGDSFPNCKFIKDAFNSKNSISGIEDEIKSLPELAPLQELEDLRKEYDSKIYLLEHANNSLHDATKKLLELNEIKNKIKKRIVSHQECFDLLEANKNQIVLRTEIESLEKELIVKERETQRLFSDWLEHNNQVGLVESNIQHCRSALESHQKLLKEYEAYELYLKCMHSNGIAYDIIKQKLPLLNNEIEKILDGIVNFTVKFETDGKKLNILLCRNDVCRSVTMGSGAEQAIASIAVTLALRTVSTLPMSDMCILDEPIDALDDDLKTEFMSMLESLKSKFRFIILITHLDFLKDIVDEQITIENIEGYSKCSK